MAFGALQWDFKDSTERLETRIVAEASSRGALENALGALTDHDNMCDYELLSKRGEAAHVRTVIAETDAMGVIRDHDGYITGPFHIEDASERWHVGFDGPAVTGAALGALERNNEFDVLSRESLELSTLQRVAQDVEAARTLVEGCHDLSAVERATLQSAVERGYFNTPRDATLSTLAEEFGVSSPAVSKNLRRAQRKIAGSVVDALDDVE